MGSKMGKMGEMTPPPFITSVLKEITYDRRMEFYL